MGRGFKNWTREVVASDDLDTIHWQSVMGFTTAAERSSAISTSVRQGMVSYVDDGEIVEVYSGSAWERAVTFGAWTSYVPDLTWSGGGTNINGGTLTGKYTRMGSTIHFQIAMTFAAGTTGSGRIRITLPFTAASASTNGGATFEDTGTNVYSGAINIAASGTYFDMASASGAVTQTVPFTMGNGDIILAGGTYETSA